MENLVYFPTFEPLSTNWLKFALLYVDNFNPIIPDGGRDELTVDYERVINETDLITPYRPSYEQGDRASLKATDFIDKINLAPYRYTNIFNRPNIIRTFQNLNQGLFKIFEGKYSIAWQDYCLQNGFGERTNGGILVSEELGFLFMTFLAEEISSEEGKSIITADRSFDNFLNFRRTIPRRTYDTQTFAQGILSLTLPRNISEISITNLIRFRNRNRERIRAFNNELNNSLDDIRNGVTARGFVDRFNNIYSELTVEILTQGLGVTTIPLAIYILLQNAAATPEYINQIIGGLGIMLNAKTAVSTKWKQIANKHKCKRYLTNLERLR